MPNCSSPPNRIVAALLYDGLCTFEFGITAEIFGLNRPEMGKDWYQFVTCSECVGPLSTNSGVTITAEHGLEALAKAGTIVIPGWRTNAAEPSAKLKEALLAAHRRGARLVTICSGAFLLAQVGLLRDRRATTHWRYADRLRELFPAIEVDANVLYVDDGDILTSAGSAAGIDLLVHVVRNDFGPAAANIVARRLVVSPHRSGGQAQFIDRPVPSHPGSQFARVLDAVRASPARQWTIAKMARMAVMSERSFNRKFRDSTGLSPGAWVMTHRLAIARDLLETTDWPIERIATEAGIGTAANLRSRFRGEVGLPPADYRKRFGLRATAA